MTIIREGSIALSILIGTPVHPNMPNVHIMLRKEVTIGITAEIPLLMKNRIEANRIKAESGPNNLKSSNNLRFNSAFILGGPT